MNVSRLLGIGRELSFSLRMVIFASLVNRLGTFIFPLLTVYLTTVRGLSVASVGAIMSIGSLGLILGNLASGILNDKWVPKYVAILSFVINIIGYLGLMAQYEHTWLYPVFLFVGLMGMGMFGPAANVIISNLSTPSNCAIAYTANYVSANIGFGLGPLIGGFLLDYSYRAAFVGDIALSIACVLIIWLGIARSDLMSQSSASVCASRSEGYLTMLRANKNLTLVCLSGFFVIGPLIALEYLVPLLVKNVFHYPTSYIGLTYSINSVVVLGLSFVIERTVRGRDELLVMAFSGLLWVVGLITIAAGFSVQAVLVGTVFWTMGEIVHSIIVPVYIGKEAPPGAKGRFLSLDEAVVSSTRIIFPLGLGFLWEFIGPRATAFAVTILPMLAVVLLLSLYKWKPEMARVPPSVEAMPPT